MVEMSSTLDEILSEIKPSTLLEPPETHKPVWRTDRKCVNDPSKWRRSRPGDGFRVNFDRRTNTVKATIAHTFTAHCVDHKSCPRTLILGI
jgi:hypothetical protein